MNDMKRFITVLTLTFLFVNNVFSQVSDYDMNYNLSKEDLINLRLSRNNIKDERVERNNEKNTQYLWEYVIEESNSDESFEFGEAIELSNGNVAVTSDFYYRSGFGDFYSAHPALMLLNSNGDELVRNDFFRPGYTMMSTPPYLFEKNNELYALTTYSPEHDFLSFNHFMNYENPPTDAILALYKFDETLNIVESYEHSFPIDTFENRGWDTWEYLPNEYSGNLFLFSAFEDEGDIVGAYYKIVSTDPDNPRGFDSLFFFRMNFDGEIVKMKSYETEFSGGWYQALYRRNHIVKTDSYYIMYDRGLNNIHGEITYYDKDFNLVETKYLIHPGYNVPAPTVDFLRDITVRKSSTNKTYLSVTASSITNPHSDYYNDVRLYILDDDLDAAPMYLSNDNYIVRGSPTTYEISPLLGAVDVAPDSLLFFACNYDLNNKPYCIIECLNEDLDTISTLYYGNKIRSLRSTEDGDLYVTTYKSVAKFPATVFGFEPDNIEEAHAHNLHLAVAYPNPGGDVLNIRTGLRNATLQVYDMQGRIVYQQIITDEVTSIDASKWNSGTYIWKLKIENGKLKVEEGKWVK